MDCHLGVLFGQVSHHTGLPTNPTIDPVWITTVQKNLSSWKDSRNWVFLPQKHDLEILVWRDPAIHPETWRVEPPEKAHANTAPHLIEDVQCQLPLQACFAAADHLSYSNGPNVWEFLVKTLKEMWWLHKTSCEAHFLEVHLLCKLFALWSRPTGCWDAVGPLGRQESDQTMLFEIIWIIKHEHWFTYLQFQTIWEESQLHIYIQSNKHIPMDVQGSFRTRNTLNVATSSSKCCSAPPLKTHSKSSQHQQSQVEQTYTVRS